jgi:hypothetical protein
MKTEVTMETICLPSEDVVARLIEGEIIIVPLVAGIGDADDELYTLNETGQAIWQRLDGNTTLSRVAADLAKEFSSPAAEIRADVLGFASEMIKRGILAVKG